MGFDVSVLSKILRMCHLDTAQCRILKDSGRFLVKIPWGLGLNHNFCEVVSVFEILICC